jgi:hypothetical protein
MGTEEEKRTGQVTALPATIAPTSYLNVPGVRQMLDQSICAEVKVGSEHLRLFSEQNAQGVQASVYNVNAKKWIAPSESVENIEQGKKSRDVRRGLPQTGREPGAAAIEVAGISSSIARA